MKKDKLNLKSLTLNNFATFVNQEINFTDGFNVIVGETGSGKSLILDALQLVFGNRADKKIIRKNESFATVEAVFVCNSDTIKEYFAQLGHPFSGDEILIKRIITSEGSSKAYLNFQQCSLQTLSTISKRFIDLVGQFDNQKLLSEDYQMALLDEYSKNTTLLTKYRDHFTKLQSLQEELNTLIEKSKTKAQRKDYLEFQISELEKVNPSNDEEEQLIELKNSILDAQKKSESFTEANHILSESNSSILSLLNKFELQVNRYDLLSEVESSQLIEAKELLSELSFNISKKLNTDSDDSELQDIIEKLDSYQKLKRKFNVTTSELESIYNNFLDEYQLLENSDLEIKKISEKINSLKEKCWTFAHELHSERESYSTKLSKELTQKVKKLRMSGATIAIEVQTTDELSKNGISKIEFNAETNSGEGYYKVKDIASGGELSRILLALRQVLSKGDTVSVFLFDEIDTGIGGETAITIGKALEEVSSASQVIAITHLPQIAKFSRTLIDVSKKQEKSRTFSYTSEITQNNREQYIRDMAQL
ncbi:putative DNA repair protein [Halobacteriovorax marinus SJ]|uniref:DNA repair protein RecN n=1 Tax=Halobacteriovorax marinus (strain ATCC BAA-682 / DSM 15412 / SJ) TaxID=862908 RepID=E1X269_HALMS|nr:AAA family ATPase [Halobacteriovorax marinus]CBW25025.1 putative DNA repair protein [Halobacteriovorax marinus SJ]